MTNKELKDYLNKFEDESGIAIVAVYPEKRKVYEHEGIIVLTDFCIPAIILTIIGERDMCEEELAISEECENIAYEKYREQHPLPKLKNNDQRKVFLGTYRGWPIWFAVPEADEVYYRYDLPDESSIVICEYKQYLEHLEKYGQNPEKTYTREYLLKPGYRYLSDCRSSNSQLVEHLRKAQK